MTKHKPYLPAWMFVELLELHIRNLKQWKLANMDDLLKVVSSVKNNDAVKAEANQETTSRPNAINVVESKPTLKSPEDALGILKSRPGKPEVLDVLSFIDPANAAEGQFTATTPSSTAAQIVHVLVSTTIPDHWHSLSSDDESVLSNSTGKWIKPQAAFLRCLSSVTGIGAIIAQLRRLLSSQTTVGEDKRQSGTQIIIRDLVVILSRLLRPRGLILHIYSDLSKHLKGSVQQQLTWKELISLLAAGKVLSTAAEACKVARDNVPSKHLWVGEGGPYAAWAGEVISHMATKLESGDTAGWTRLSSFTGRALTLGYTGKE